MLEDSAEPKITSDSLSRAQSASPHPADIALWLRLETRRVISHFIAPLARTQGWRTLYIVSPWLSAFPATAGMTFRQFLKRVSDENVTVYLITRRPVPEQSWHLDAVEEFRATGQANIVFVANLHTKLYCARTTQQSFALLGSANLTGLSLNNRELGLVVRRLGSGVEMYDRLEREAMEIYRDPARVQYANKQFKIKGS